MAAPAEAVTTEAQEEGPVDIEAVIAEFLRDERPSLELPRSLTAEQRKQAKRLAEQHPELKCESYGYGEDRCLHLFKKNNPEGSPGCAVRVKNTFIDDFEDGEGRDAVVFRSMPPSFPENLLERTLQRCQQGAGGEALCQPPAADSPAPNSVDRRSNSPSSAGPELPPMPEGFQIRNTFIHIESVPEVERIVQSMPDGMFHRCLAEELSAQNPAASSRPPAAAPTAEASAAPVPAAPATAAPAAAAYAAPPTAPAPDVEHFLTPGTEVIIQGLLKLPDFNGLTGVVQSMDAESGRYDVLLENPAGNCGWRWVKVKGENCRPCMPPPPRDAPRVSMGVVQAR